MTPKIYTSLRKASDKEKQSSGCDKVKKWPLNGNFMAIWDKICCTLAALERCLLVICVQVRSRGTCNWPFKGGARLIEVAATAGGTVFD